MHDIYWYVLILCCVQQDEGQVPVVDDSASYELIYNGACRLLAAGRFEQALEKLQNAEEQCRTYLTQEEGATEDEVNEEVAIIRCVC